MPELKGKLTKIMDKLKLEQVKQSVAISNNPEQLVCCAEEIHCFLKLDTI